jgi:N-dimethylarginine dimethylaminohydrolase
MTAPLRRVLLRPPRSNDLHFWNDYGWRAKPDPHAIAREHEALCGLLTDHGTEVVLAETRVAGDPDAIYVYDPALIADTGAVLLRPGKAGRRREPDALGADLDQAGVPIAGRLEGSSLGEGGDLIRLDEATLLVGLGYRTNQAGAQALAQLSGLDVITFDLPRWHGESEVMHLLSLLSPLADDLVVAYPPIRRCCRLGLRNCWTREGSRSCQCRMRSSSRWARTRSRSRRGSRSLWTATRRRAGA